MKTALTFLIPLAVILIIFAYFAVFGPPTGSYAINGSGLTSNITGSSSIWATSTSSFPSTTSTILVNATSTAPTTGSFSSSFQMPPLTWPEGQSKISITGLSLEATQMAFTLSVETGAAPECVPLNLRLVADEEGDLDPPTPASFSFPDSGNCNGTPNQTYTNQTVTFGVDPTALPLLFTTGGSSTIFFEVATTSDNGLQVVFPGTSG